MSEFEALVTELEKLGKRYGFVARKAPTGPYDPTFFLDFTRGTVNSSTYAKLTVAVHFEKPWQATDEELTEEILHVLRRTINDNDLLNVAS